MIGQTVGNYRITKLLGQGGMGVVYLAEHPGIGRKAAVKVLHAELSKNQEIVGRFFNEARAANAIHHPGIVDVLDFGTLTSGAPYIVMEFLDGESLASRIKRNGRLGLGDAVEITLQAAAALGAAHANGIVHRDLKPDNLFLVPDPRTPGREMVKVLDFGIAKLGVGSVRGGSVKTQTGVVMGTPVYMSPEQCRGTKEVDHRTDVYALAIILYEMLCGDPPFGSEGHGELLYLQISAAPPPPRTRNPSIPLEVENLILRALAKDPANRTQSMVEFQQVLQSSTTRKIAASSSGLNAPKPGEVLPPSSDQPAAATTMSSAATTVARKLTKHRWRWGVPIAVGALMVGAAVLLAVTSTSGKRSPTTPSPAPLRSAMAPEPSSPSTAPRIVPILLETASANSEPAASGAQVVREKEGTVIGLAPSEQSRATATGGGGSSPPANPSQGYRQDFLASLSDEEFKALMTASEKEFGALMSARTAKPRQKALLGGPPRGGTATAAPFDPNQFLREGGPSSKARRVRVEDLSDEELMKLIGAPVGQESPGLPNGSPLTGQSQRVRPRGGCAITIGTRPWSELWIDGKNTGRHTPYSEPINCGEHTLTFKRPDLDLSRTVNIAVRADEKFKQSYSLEAEEPTMPKGADAPPAQADIIRVIDNNRQGIQTCYRRALLRDSTLTDGGITIRVSIDQFGKVKSINLDGPAQFRSLEPCIRDVMSGWPFPPSSKEYGTAFPVVLQGIQ